MSVFLIIRYESGNLKNKIQVISIKKISGNQTSNIGDKIAITVNGKKLSATILKKNSEYLLTIIKYNESH